MNLRSAIALSTLTALTIARAVPFEPFNSLSRHPFLDSGLNVTTTNGLSSFHLDGPATAVDGDSAWDRSVNQGAKLVQGMKMGDKEAGELYGLGDSAESPYDGDLHDTLEAWGYMDNAEGMKASVDKECNMDSGALTSGQWLKKAFDELGMGTKSKGKGGPNECFQIEHYNSAAVIPDENGKRPPKDQQWYKAPCGTDFRVTGAEHTVGVNEGKLVYM
jgi:hypothetical protein